MKSNSNVPVEIQKLRGFKVKTPTVLQMEAVECGAAALAMILGYFKRYVPLEILRVECGVSRDGSKASNIQKAARKYGLECHGYSREPKELVEFKLPMILFWEFNHFVVLDGIKKGKVYINDPAKGRRVLSWAEFDKSFTGIVLTFAKTEKFEQGGEKASIIPILRKQIKESWNILGYIVATGLLLIIPGLVIPSFSRVFVDDIIVPKMGTFLKPLLFSMVCVAVIQALLNWLQHLFLLRFDMKLAVMNSSVFLNRIFHLPIEFFSQRMPGEIVNRMQLNDQVVSVLSSKIATTFLNLFSVLFFGFLMFRYDVVLALLCLASVVLNVLVMQILMKKQENDILKQSIENGKLYGITMNGIQMIETIKASGAENDSFCKWAGQQANIIRGQQSLGILESFATLIPSFLQKMLDISILIIGSQRIMSGSITMGMLVAFQGLMGSFTSPVLSLMKMFQTFQTTFADMKRINDVMNYPVPAVKEDPPFIAGEDVRLQGFVELNHVAFGYSRLEPPLLDDFNLKLEPGKRIALVGGSGSGKSTVAKLVSGLYQPWSGEILFDGKPVTEIGKKRFTSSIAMVDQDIFIFEGSVKENLTMWDEDIQESDIIAATKDACIHDMITSRPGEYFAFMEESGGNFSGGQKQRIEIARALCTNPRILILDEATSALDPVTEKMVDDNIRARGCACLIVAHRLSTIRDADEIIVLDHGKIAERGTHKELLQKKGYYYNLIQNY